MTVKLPQTLIGVGTLVLAAAMAAGATQISSDAGYGGVGPNFVPWVVAVALALCGGFLVWESVSGGFREAAARPSSVRSPRLSFRTPHRAHLAARSAAAEEPVTSVGLQSR